VIVEFVPDCREAQARAETIGISHAIDRACWWQIQAVEEAPVSGGKLTDERRVLTGNLQRIEAVALEELPDAGTDDRFAFPVRIIGQAQARGNQVVIVIEERVIRSSLSAGARWAWIRAQSWSI